MPAKYSFHLDSVLNYRKIIEEEKEREFALALRTVQLEENKIGEIENLIKQKTVLLGQIEHKNFTSNDILAYKTYLSHLENEKNRQIKKVNQLKRELAKKREVFIAATKDRKVMDRLKELGWKRFIKHLSHQEQLFLDEVAITRFGRNQRLEKGV